jgi:tetratricopeptide (TPR) repeat protein
MQHRIAINLGSAGHMQGARPRRAMIEESLAYFRRVGFARGEAQCLTFLANLARDEGDLERALEDYDRAIRLSHQTGFTWWEIHSLLARAETLFRAGRTDEGLGSAREGLKLAHGIRDRIGTVEGLALLVRASGDTDEELAGRLWGAVEAELGRAPLPGLKDELDELVRDLVERAGDAFESGRAEGRALSLDEAVELALAASD